MRASHQDQIERWAKFVRDNPTSWKKEHTRFINAIFAKRREFERRILQTPNGEEKLKQLRELRTNS